jgi:hypothetical protein
VKPYIVLGIYKPKVWRAWRIGRDLTDLTEKLGLEPHYDPAHGPLERVPWHSTLLHAEVRKRSFKTKMAEGWHYDGDTTPGSKPECGIVLWASNNPTEIMWRDCDGCPCLSQPKPYEVVLFANLECLHRRPEGVPRIRWVFRQRVHLPKGGIHL